MHFKKARKSKLISNRLTKNVLFLRTEF